MKFWVPAARGLISDDILHSIQQRSTHPLSPCTKPHSTTPPSAAFPCSALLLSKISGNKPREKSRDLNGPYVCVTVIMEPTKGGIYPSGNENRGCVTNKAAARGHIAAVAMITFNRPRYLRKAVDSLLTVHRKDPSFKCALDAYISLLFPATVRKHAFIVNSTICHAYAYNQEQYCVGLLRVIRSSEVDSDAPSSIQITNSFVSSATWWYTPLGAFGYVLLYTCGCDHY